MPPAVSTQRTTSDVGSKRRSTVSISPRSASEVASVAYVRQKEPLGLGHAILCARALVGEEPFGVFLGDDIIGSAPTPCMRQLLDVFERHEGPVIAVERVPRERIHQYGVIAGRNIGDNVWQIDDLVEIGRASCRERV